jgi:hypothetical protein
MEDTNMTHEIKLDTSQFTCTENWYRHSLMPHITYTDGVKYVADTARAYWLLDAIVSWQLEPHVKAEEFQQWTLKVADRRATLVCDDGNDNEVCKQEIAFTDFPEPEIKFWFTNNVILLPSEY